MPRSSKPRINWRGNTTLDEVKAVLSDAIVELTLRMEAAAKQNLRPSARDARGRWVKGGGRGKRTGTLQRSIHAASPDYPWSSDDVDAESGGPERGGGGYKPQVTEDAVTGAVGSGLVYALALHQDDSSEGKHYMVNAYEEVRKDTLRVVEKHAKRRRA